MKRRDIILLCTIFIVGIILYLMIFVVFREEGDIVKISYDGTTIIRLPLNADDEYNYEDGQGNYNHIVIKNGAVRIDDASCPDQLCVRHHSISMQGESIICLPNRIVVSIVENSEAEGTDTIAR